MRPRLVLGLALEALLLASCSSAASSAAPASSAPPIASPAAAAPASSAPPIASPAAAAPASAVASAAPVTAAPAPTAPTGSTGATDACALATKDPVTAYNVLGSSLTKPGSYPEPVPSDNQGQSVCTFTGERGTLTVTVDPRPEAKAMFETNKSGPNALPFNSPGADESYGTRDNASSLYSLDALKGGTAVYLLWKLPTVGYDASAVFVSLTAAMGTMMGRL